MPDLGRAKPLMLLSLWVLLPAAAPALPLQPLTEEDVGADALRNAACYAHDGPHVLLVAAERNAVVNSDGDLRLLQRNPDRGPVARGARYIGSRFEITVSPAGEAVSDPKVAGRGDGPAQISIAKAGVVSTATARWNCKI